MRRIHAIFLVLFLALPAALRADDKEVKEVLERAIKAHGGAAVLAKSAQMKRTDTGTQAVLGKQLPFTSQVVRSLPDRIRLQIEIDRSIKTLIVLDGDKAWESQGGPAVAQSAQRVREMREEVYVDWVTTLVPLTKPGFTLSSLPRAKVGSEPAAGIKVVRKGHADTNLYFLERNGLLVKVERRTTVAGLAVDKEYLYSAFRDFEGLKLHTKEVVQINGKKFTEFTISDVSMPARLEPRTFAKP
jgi:hypothetical protein